MIHRLLLFIPAYRRRCIEQRILGSLNETIAFMKRLQVYESDPNDERRRQLIQDLQVRIKELDRITVTAQREDA